MLTEDEALRLITEAVERAGGARHIVAHPRHPFALQSTEAHEVDNHEVTVHFSEMSAPAIAEVGGWIFEIREHEFVLLQRPRVRKPPSA